ncbi:hypothetical protein Tco_1375723 [Tanacetum coccineum]
MKRKPSQQSDLVFLKACLKVWTFVLTSLEGVPEACFEEKNFLDCLGYRLLASSKTKGVFGGFVSYLFRSNIEARTLKVGVLALFASQDSINSLCLSCYPAVHGDRRIVFFHSVVQVFLERYVEMGRYSLCLLTRWSRSFFDSSLILLLNALLTRDLAKMAGPLDLISGDQLEEGRETGKRILILKFRF